MMNWNRIAAVLLLAFAGCASYKPIVDTKGVDMNKYTEDLGECQKYAEEINPAAHAAGGAVAGAVLGAAIGSIFGNRRTAGQGAAAYGVLGAGAGGAEGAAGQRNVILKCMAGRGYRVLY